MTTKCADVQAAGIRVRLLRRRRMFSAVLLLLAVALCSFGTLSTITSRARTREDLAARTRQLVSQRSAALQERVLEAMIRVQTFSSAFTVGRGGEIRAVGGPSAMLGGAERLGPGRLILADASGRVRSGSVGVARTVVGSLVGAIERMIVYERVAVLWSDSSCCGGFSASSRDRPPRTN